MNMRKVMINKKAQTKPYEISKESKVLKNVQPPSSSTGNGAITLKDVKEIAKSKGINPGKMKKADLIKAIQKAEGNFDCFGTATAGHCDQLGCFWMTECLSSRRPS